ncbi:MAG: signal transduction protein [Gammaproteobacteria bacterium]|nr:signal transduction protein [Gammaproteobacteria bacterium]
MRVVHQASPWRSLFHENGTLNTSALNAPLDHLFSKLFAKLSSPNTSLADAYAWQLPLVETLVHYDLPAWRISQIISDHNASLYRQAVALSLDEMQAQGWGPPPVGYCVLMLGSAARFESLLGPDQDNALIIDDYPDYRHVEIDGYFQALGERFTQRLDEAGIPLCHGHVMARWPMWRKRLSEWQAQLEIWSADRQVKRVQQTNILLDFAPVAGNPVLAEQLGNSIASILPKASLFMNEMAALLEELPVALDRFGRLASSPGLDAPHEHAINLKHQGLLPLISAARLLCLRHGLANIATRERLIALSHRADVLTSAESELLVAAFERLQQRLLDQQRYNKARGQTADGWVDLRRLREDERLLLKFDLQQVRSFVQRVKNA